MQLNINALIYKLSIRYDEYAYALGAVPRLNEWQIDQPRV
eukprot:COSAG02_NODE_1922_length_10360_cov_38.101452_6_plen_40_part_00